VRLLAPAVLGPAGALALWLEAGDPGRLGGLALLAAAGLVLALAAGAWASLCFSWPALVPAGWRRRYRRRRREAGLDRGRAGYISGRLRRRVRLADRNACTGCGAPALRHPHVDHFFPFSLGGRTVFLNCMLLCPECNEAKGNYWEFPSGRSVYRVMDGVRPDRPRAAAILAAQRRARRRPGRWIRALMG